MLDKAARGELTPTDCARFIAATRAGFLAAAAKAPKASTAKPKIDENQELDFF